MNNSMQKAKEAKDTKNKLMLVQSPLSAKQLLHILQRTPAEHIYKRPGKGGGEFEYVTSTYMKKVLNHVFGWMWDFEIKEHGREKDMVWVLGKLTVKDKNGKPMIIKEQFGRSEVKFYKDREKGTVDFGNDLKAAASDALKKCAAELGIASDVYGRQEFKEIQKVDKGFIPPVPMGEVINSMKNNKIADLKASANEKLIIERLCKQLGASDPVKGQELINKAMGRKTNYDDLTKVEAGEVIGKLGGILNNKTKRQ